MKVLLDTCILSKFFSKKGAPLTLVDWMATPEAAISVTTFFEIEMGLKSAGLTKSLKLFPEILETYEVKIFPLSTDHASLAATQGSEMKKKGFTYSLQDLWIGATAKVEGYDLATANIKDFNHWKSLKIMNPLSTDQ